MTMHLQLGGVSTTNVVTLAVGHHSLNTVLMIFQLPEQKTNKQIKSVRKSTVRWQANMWNSEWEMSRADRGAFNDLQTS